MAYPLAAFFGLFATNVGRYITNRPILSGIHSHFISVGVSCGVMYQALEYNKRNNKQKNWFYYQYMLDHPEAFPRKERVLYRDTFQSWSPNR